MNAIYVRVSTEEQARSGYSIDGQIANCTQKGISLGLSDFEIFKDDGYSGEFIERPALDRLRQYLKSGAIKNIIIYDPDRMARVLDIQLQLTAEIEQAKANLIFCTHDYDASPEGKLFFMIRGAISQFEKSKIRERTMAGKRTKALSGKLTFNDRAYGYDYDSSNCMYIINETEADIIRLMYNMYLNGNCGVRSLSFELKALGVVNRKGKPFTQSNIYRILISEMYAGVKWAFKYYDKKINQRQKKATMRDPEEWIAVSVPAIVDRTIWDKVQYHLKQNVIFSKRNSKWEYLLRGLIKCASCGYSMIGSRKVIGSKEYVYYTCTSKSEKRQCDNGTIRADILDHAVWSQIVNMAKERFDFSNMKQKPEDTISSEKFNQHILSLKQKQSAFLKWVRDGVIAIEDADKELQALNKEISATQAALNALQQNKKPAVNIQPDEILIADTFSQRRDIMLKLNISIHARRTGWKPDNIEWYI